MHEYTSAVFGVGLDGLAPVDHERINDLAVEGWEPVHMSSAHNGLAALVLFRREVADVVPVTKAARATRSAPARKTAKAAKAAKATPARKTAKTAKAPAAARSRTTAASGAASTRKARGR